MWRTKTTTKSTSDLSAKHQKFTITSDVMSIYQKWQR